LFILNLVEHSTMCYPLSMQQRELLVDLSVLYRCAQNHFEQVLKSYDFNFTNFLLLTQIYENEGMTMIELARKAAYDKSTVTKSVAWLEDNGYITLETNLQDRRSKSLKTTEKCRKIISDLFHDKRDWMDYIIQDLDEYDKEVFFRMIAKMVERSRELEQRDVSEEVQPLKFYDIEKFNLSRYPGHTCCVLYLGGNNLRPVYADKKYLYIKEDALTISEAEVLNYLSQRKEMLEAICLTGGEPLIQGAALNNFMEKVKEMGYLIKIDTNGYENNHLKALLKEGLVDYVSMALMANEKEYEHISGSNKLNFGAIRKSINYLLDCDIEYDFSTTLIKEYHDASSFKEMVKLIKGAHSYRLYNYHSDEKMLNENLHGFEKEELKQFLDLARNYVNDVELIEEV